VAPKKSKQFLKVKVYFICGYFSTLKIFQIFSTAQSMNFAGFFEAVYLIRYSIYRKTFKVKVVVMYGLQFPFSQQVSKKYYSGSYPTV
jgi:hypothetical protein